MSGTIGRRGVIAGALATMLPGSARAERATAPPEPVPFATDIRLPGLLRALVARPPILGWSLAGFDARAALRVCGVAGVIAVPPCGAAGLARLGGVAVLARDTWSARIGREALVLDWRADAAPALGREGGFVVPETAEPLLETPCATAFVRAGRCEAWACLGDPDALRARLAEVLGLRRDAVTLHRTILGGAPGRACDPCGAVEAALLSRAAGGAPVSLLWTREDDIPFRARIGAPVG